MLEGYLLQLSGDFLFMPSYKEGAAYEVAVTDMAHLQRHPFGPGKRDRAEGALQEHHVSKLWRSDSRGFRIE